MPVKTSLQHAKLVSLTWVPVGILLRRLELVGFIHVPERRHRDISNRSAELTYQVHRHDDVSVWYRTFQISNTIGQYLLRTMQYTFLACQVVESL